MRHASSLVPNEPSRRFELDFTPGWHWVAGVAPAEMSAPAHGWLGTANGEEGARTPLGPLEPGESFGVVVSAGPELARACAWLAFEDGSTEPLQVATRPLSRRSAFERMLWHAPTDRLGPGTWRRLARMLVGFVRRGARGAAYALASTYQAPLWPDMGRRGVPCDVRTHPGVRWSCAWVPVNQLSMVDGDDEVEAHLWNADGTDPQFQLRRAGLPFALSAGWYEVSFSAEVPKGSLLGPALFPDYGQGCQQHDQIRLPEPSADGVVRTLVMLREPAVAVRLDPSVRQAQFRLANFRLRKLGRFAALLRLLDAQRHLDGGRDYRALATRLGMFAMTASRHGLSSAAERLHRRSSDDMGEDYESWVGRYDTFDRKDVEMMRERASRLDARPLFSILLPVYETPEKWLRRCLDSILAQAYPEWELCIVDDCSPSPHVGRVLAEYAARDRRIRSMRRTENGHISRASNDALAMARGSHVALMDHDDELRPHALLEMAEALVRDPDLRLIYSDEDKIDERGRRMQPYFKPDWNPDLLRSQNFICHFTVIERSLVVDAGGFRTGFEGSQDHDLFLRCTERLTASEIGHVPLVLYHWRAIPGSTAHARSAKDYASSAGLSALSDHLDRTAPGARAESLEHGHYRVRWPLPAPAPRASIIVPTRDHVDLLKVCIGSLLDRTEYPDFEVLVVDNQSVETATHAYLEQLASLPAVRVLRYDAPFNYSAINNWAAAQAHGTVLCLLNNDIEVIEPGWLEEMVSHALRPEVGAVGAMLFYPDMTIQHAGVVLGMGGVANHVYCGLPDGSPGHGARALVAQNMSAVTAACLVVRKDVYEVVGGLDEELRVAFNDIDFCLRLGERGLHNVWTPFARLVHHESATRGRDDDGEKRQRFLGEVAYMERRWQEALQWDAAYNPNLSLEGLHAGLACPPRSSLRQSR